MPGKTTKKWLWLLIPGIPAAVLFVLFLPLALIVAGHLGAALFGPFGVLNSPMQTPPEEEVVGRYQYSNDGSVNDQDPKVEASDDSGFTLRPNHELEVQNLPQLTISGIPTGCAYNGTGKWEIMGNSLNMNITTVFPTNAGSPPSCNPDNFGAFLILGKSRPYRFWYVIGDPDSGEGLLYKLR